MHKDFYMQYAKLYICTHSYNYWYIQNSTNLIHPYRVACQQLVYTEQYQSYPSLQSGMPTVNASCSAELDQTSSDNETRSVLDSNECDNSVDMNQARGILL